MKRWLTILAAALACGSLTGLQAADCRIDQNQRPDWSGTAVTLPAPLMWPVRGMSRACHSARHPGRPPRFNKEIVQKISMPLRAHRCLCRPLGANAGSAGCFITLAANVAAMAPYTSIAAAHPVSMSPGGGKTEDVMKQKLENFGSSYIEAIARNRAQRRVGKSSVRESASITAEKALDESHRCHRQG